MSERYEIDAIGYVNPDTGFRPLDQYNGQLVFGSPELDLIRLKHRKAVESMAYKRMPHKNDNLDIGRGKKK